MLYISHLIDTCPIHYQDQGCVQMLGNARNDEKIKCPKCEIYMRREKVEFSGYNITIDFCVQCHSYWYDKGEINKYIKTRIVDKKLRNKDGYLGWGKPACPRCGGKISLKFLENLEFFLPFIVICFSFIRSFFHKCLAVRLR